MFENFDTRAREAAVFAQGTARLLCHQDVGADHLLLSLCADEEGTISTYLQRCGAISRAAIYHVVEGRHPPGISLVPCDVPFTPQLKLAMRTARNMAFLAGGDEAIVQDIHLLLSLFCIDDETVPEILEQLGCNQASLHNQLAQRLGLPTPFVADDYRLPEITELRYEAHKAVENVPEDLLRIVMAYLSELTPNEPSHESKKDLSD